MKALSSALVVLGEIFGFINSHRLVAGPDPMGTIVFVICGTVLVFGVGGWIIA